MEEEEEEEEVEEGEEGEAKEGQEIWFGRLRGQITSKESEEEKEET